MPILDIQRRYRELGRIRLGQKGDRFPTKLETFRLTSPAREYIDAAAAVFGGEVHAWRSPRGDEWEVVTEAKELPVIVPAQNIENAQWWELWGLPEGAERGKAAVTCLRRCDGHTEMLSGRPCLCDPDNRECKPTTHLQVHLRDLPDLGVWRVVSHGINAAAELPATIHTLSVLMAAGARIEATLGIGHRRSVDPQGQAHRYVVPEVRIPHTTNEMLEALPADVDHNQIVAALAAGPASEATPLRPAIPPTPSAGALPQDVEPLRTPDDEEPPEVAPSLRDVSPDMTGPPPVPPDEPPDDDDHDDHEPIPEPETGPLDIPSDDDESDVKAMLYRTFAELPNDADTMIMWNAYCRQVFSLMERLGLWKPTPSGMDSLHAMLSRVHNVEHLADLHKSTLVAFTKKAHAAAVEKMQALNA